MGIDPVTEAERRWHIQLKRKSGDEYVGPCPFCNAGEDRFHVWQDRGNYWCRQCDAKGWLDEDKDLSDHERRIRELEKTMEIPQNLEVRVIMLTALDDPHTVFQSFYRVGATAYIVKPLSRQKLVNELMQLGLIKNNP